ncbi:MAG: preprotein translocase subunit SecG [Candidatus Omnitrophota bacterium]|nr:preprotein translocase subunit SecG [Candidatus Omnitrophota bacterium]
MMTFLIIIHVTACVVLIGLVLIQRGRGAGLVESFAGVESMFGTKTSAFLTRITTVMSIVFFLTCLALAVLSVKQSKSLMRDIRVVKPKTDVVAAEAVKTEIPKTENVKVESVNSGAPVVVAAVETAKPDAAKAQ